MERTFGELMLYQKSLSLRLWRHGKSKLRHEPNRRHIESPP